MENKEFFEEFATKNLLEWGFIKMVVAPGGVDYVVAHEILERIEKGEYLKILDEIREKAKKKKEEIL